MMDMRVWHSCATERVVNRFQLQLKNLYFKLKTVNFEAKLVLNMTTMELGLEPYKGRCRFTADPIDDFDLMINKDFVVENMIYPIPHLDGFMVDDGLCPDFVPAVKLPR